MLVAKEASNEGESSPSPQGSASEAGRGTLIKGRGRGRPRVLRAAGPVGKTWVPKTDHSVRAREGRGGDEEKKGEAI